MAALLRAVILRFAKVSLAADKTGGGAAVSIPRSADRSRRRCSSHFGRRRARRGRGNDALAFDGGRARCRLCSFRRLLQTPYIRLRIIRTLEPATALDEATTLEIF